MVKLRNTPIKRKQKDNSSKARKSVNDSTGETKILITVNIKRHMDKNGGHPHIIIENIEDKHVSVGLSKQRTKGKNSTHTNYPCEKNPLGGSAKSYMRRQGTVDKKSNYVEPQKGKMTSNDFSTAIKYGQKAKEKYLREKNKKK